MQCKLCLNVYFNGILRHKKQRERVWLGLFLQLHPLTKSKRGQHCILTGKCGELNQDLCDKLFDADHDVKTQSREKLCQHIDDLMNATYGSELQVIHTCNGDSVQTCLPRPVHEIYQEKSAQVLRNARHRVLCHDIGGKVMECKKCKEEVSTTSIIDMALHSWREMALRGQQSVRGDYELPMIPERLDMAAYTYSYHMDGGCVP